MKIKVKLTPTAYEGEIDLMELYCSVPYVEDRKIHFFIKNLVLWITSNIWKQIPSSEKDKIYDLLNSYEGNSIEVKTAKITMTDISAYSIAIGDKYIMEEIYENFDSEYPIDEYLPQIIFPNETGRFLFQVLGDVYVEFDTDDISELRFLTNKEIDKTLSNKGLSSYYLENNKKIENNLLEIDKKYYRKQETKEELEIMLSSFIKRHVKIYPYNLKSQLEKLLNLLSQMSQLEYIISEELKKEIEYWLLEIAEKSLENTEKKILREIVKLLESRKIDIFL